ncbi:MULTISPECIES: monovalent cation/H(+) antiporter subunit G [Cytobacillus]|uniref:Na+/H+ antiporter subunit G n=1 Tax=Cytobacillus stercorigallinarum TaxID=2762240 RepID=A0ABR8QUC3_9BACI|nr:monovalent cation/H(+) antiporter subunit G [Cytobacillus stercorigallinarum]MBD7939135.1 Na+/H+ antiporter subunit G [Cytobacillus stercorigallinarum]
MIEIANIIIVLFIILGAFFHLIAALGVLRLPDVYTRNHAASKAATLGVLCILLATFFYFYFHESEFNTRVLLCIVFMFLTAPVAGHLLGRAAYHHGVKMEGSKVDEYEEYIKVKKSNEPKKYEAYKKKLEKNL